MIDQQWEHLRNHSQQVSGRDFLQQCSQHFLLPPDSTNLSPIDLADLARAYGNSCTYDSLETSTLQGTTAINLDPLLQLDLSYVIVDPDELARKKEWLLGE